jgi:dTDP-4-dehydrorhamnose 3,5-epimerase
VRGVSALPAVQETAIPGLLQVHLDLRDDRRGWFKEDYQEAKLRSAGLPALRFVQHNVSYNAPVGVTRGVHAEPWEKYVSLAAGEAFAAVVDLRRGPGFGRVVTARLSPATALLLPRGCGNAFQTLAPHTVYTYLVTAHWSPDAPYVAVDAFDPELAIPWPLDRSAAVVSEKDEAAPPLAAVRPLEPA